MRSQRHINIIRRQFNSTLRVIIHRDYTAGILSPQQLQSFGRCGGNSTVRPPLGYILTAATNKTIRIWSIKYAVRVVYFIVTLRLSIHLVKSNLTTTAAAAKRRV